MEFHLFFISINFAIFSFISKNFPFIGWKIIENNEKFPYKNT